MALYIRRVLVADGDGPTGELLKLCLTEDARWTTNVVTTAAELFRSVRRQSVDVLLLGDVTDKVTTEVIAELRAAPHTAKLPVLVMLAGESTKELADRSRELGATGFLRKPIVTTKLPDVIRQQVGAESGPDPNVLFRGR